MTRSASLPILAAAALAGALLAPGARAQVVRGQVSEAGSGAPIQGVFISLVDSTDARRASTLSDPAGDYIVRAPAAGTYTLQAERIGYETATAGPLALADGRTLRRSLEVPSTAVELEGISVSAERKCDVDPGRGGELNALWEEIGKAFTVAEWVQESGVARFRIQRFSRVLDLETGTVRQETVRHRTGYSEQPFVAPEPSSLEEDGYVRRENGRYVYHAPDVRALRSPGFLRTHCFRAVEGRQEGTFGLVGLEFTPVEDREVPDVRGTLWVDEESAELRRVEFAYTGLEGVRRARQIGGEVHFRRLPTGAWIVSRWTIRMPVRGTTRAWWRDAADRDQEVLAGLQEVGGEVVELSTVRGGLDIAGDRATLQGLVWDSLRSEPVAGAQVFLDGTSHSARTDDEGRFALTGIPEGRYSVAFHHDRVSDRGLYIPDTRVELSPGEVRRVRLALPSLATMVRASCAEAQDSAGVGPERRAILAGVVRDAVTGTPLPRAPVKVEWSGPGEPTGRTRKTETDEGGRYRFCTLPDGRRATVSTELMDEAVGATAIALSAAEPRIRHLELELTLATPVVVEVTEHGGGSPIEGAEVELRGLGEAVITGAEGRASFGEVPPGMHAIRVEHLAYGTVRDSILVRSAEVVRVRVRMATRAIALEPIVVEVEGRRRPTTGIGMMGPTKARGTRGDVMTTEEIDAVLPRSRDLPDLLRSANFPALSIQNMRMRAGARGEIPVVCIETHRRASPTMGEGCNMVTVYVDDRRLPNPTEYLYNLPASFIRRIEVLSPLEAGSIYGLQAQNGVLLIYTRTGASEPR